MEYHRPEAEIARIRYLYKNLLIRGKIPARLRHSRRARNLLGPDCAYHLLSGPNSPP